jgi:hypothetical protein
MRHTYPLLDQAFDYYTAHQNELVKRFAGRYLVFVGQHLTGDYKDFDAANDAALKQYKPGEFLIQECGPGEENHTIKYHTARLAF